MLWRRHLFGLLCFLAISPATVNAQSRMFWLDASPGNAIQNSMPDGTDTQLVVSPFVLPYGAQITDIAVAPAEAKVYWTQNDELVGIARSDFDGTNVEPIAQHPGSFSYLAIDAERQKIYWTGDGIYRANMDGSDVETVVAPEDAAQPIQIDGYFGGNKIYWISEFESTIKCANLDGTSVETIIFDAGDSPYAIEVDPYRQRIYWSDLLSDRILSARLDGSDVQTYITTAGYTTGIAVAEQSTYIYWAQSGGPGAERGIWRALSDGSNPEHILVHNAPWTVTFDTSAAQPALPASTPVLLGLAIVVVAILARPMFHRAKR